MTLFLDTSALIKLSGEEDHRDTAIAAVRDSSQVVVSVVAYPEARSALARKMREGTLPRDNHDRVVDALNASWDGLYRVRITYEIAESAGEIAEQLALRGFDAIHLACAVRAHDRLGNGFRFLAFDNRLMDAARQVVPVYETE
jgi:uncharacterized protein